MAFDQQRFGKYRLLRRIAAGGMGEVHLAKLVGPAGFEKLVVIKRLLEARRNDSKYVEMFFSEARVAAQLTHSNIAQVYETGDVEGVPYIAMEYVHGKSLRKILDQAEALGAQSGQPRVPVAFIGHIIAQLCRGLSFAHEATHLSGAVMGLIHRDINPLNVLISYQGEVKIIDFGIAKSELNIDKTQAGTIKGTVVYMSPEQSLGNVLDKRSDLFSVGICLYEALSGKNPFHKGSLGASLDAIRRAAVPPLDAGHPELTPFARVLSHVLRSRPEERYPDCGTLADELESLLGSGAVARPKENLPGYMRRLFATDIQEEETTLERTDAAHLEELEAVPPARGAGTAVLGERRAAGAVVVSTSSTGQLHGERTSGGKPVPQVSSVYANIEAMRSRPPSRESDDKRPSSAATDPLIEGLLPSDSSEEVTGAGLVPDARERAPTQPPAAQFEDAPPPVPLPQAAPPEAPRSWLRRATASLETQAPWLAGFLRWEELVPGRFGGRFGLPFVLVGCVLVGATAVAFWLGRKSEEVPLASAMTGSLSEHVARTQRSAPSFLEGEVDEVTQAPLRRLPDDADGLSLLDSGEPRGPLKHLLPGASSKPAPPTHPAAAAPAVAPTLVKKPAAAPGLPAHKAVVQKRFPLPTTRPVRSSVRPTAQTPTVRLRADPPLAMRHNSQLTQNPVRLHTGKGLLELRGGPGGNTFTVRIAYDSVERDVSFTVDSEPWADVFGAGGISLGRTPVRVSHAGASTMLVLKNPRIKTPQHITLKMNGQQAVRDE